MASVLAEPIDHVAQRVNFCAGFHGKQMAAVRAIFTAPVTRILAGGSGFGGKSYLQQSAHGEYQVRCLLEGASRVPTMMTGADYGSLKDRMVMPFMERFRDFCTLHGDHKEYGTAITWMDDRMGPILIRNAVSGQGMEGRKGTNVGLVTIDELTEFTRKQYGAAAYTARHPSAPWRSVLAGSNPDGIGYMWVREGWRPDLYEGSDGVESEDSPRWAAVDESDDPGRRIYVPFLPTDNPEYDEATFLASIADLPAHIQAARRYGLWTAPENARFGYLSDVEHRFDRRERWPQGIPREWPRMVAVDYGYRAPFAAVWMVQEPDGNWFVYKELYRTQVPADAQIAMIREKTGPDESVSRFVGDPAMFSETTSHYGERQPSVASVYRDGIARDGRFPGGFVAGPRGSKVLKLATLDKYLRRGNGYPDLWIDRSCSNLWLELSGAVYRTGTALQELSEELDPRVPDHAIDALVYAFHDFAPEEVAREAAKEPVVVGRYDDIERRAARELRRRFRS